MGKKVLAFNGSPRPSGNTTQLLRSFEQGVLESDGEIEVIQPLDLNLKYCTGCLRCNLLKRCSLRDDDWNDLSLKILEADVLVFASPVYFHHLPAPLKMVIDRFRSFHHVQITGSGLEHTPWQKWNKDFVLLLTMGSPDPSEATPIIDMFEFMTGLLGPGNRLHVVTATRLAVVKQVIKTAEELQSLYEKMRIPVHLAGEDFRRNQGILEQSLKLGRQLAV